MTERLLLALTFVAVVLSTGALVRAIAHRRALRLAATAELGPSPAGKPRLLVFSSRWCSDCASQHTVIEDSRAVLAHAVEISYHDAVSESELAHRLGILLVPSLVLADAGGRVIEIKQGFVDEDPLRSLLELAA